MLLLPEERPVTAVAWLRGHWGPSAVPTFMPGPPWRSRAFLCSLVTAHRARSLSSWAPQDTARGLPALARAVSAALTATPGRQSVLRKQRWGQTVESPAVGKGCCLPEIRLRAEAPAAGPRRWVCGTAECPTGRRRPRLPRPPLPWASRVAPPPRPSPSPRSPATAAAVRCQRAAAPPESPAPGVPVSFPRGDPRRPVS